MAIMCHRQSLARFVVAACTCALASCAAHPHESRCIATIAGGRVEGSDLDSACAYLGIPYAAPPVGELRWKPPQPARPWTAATLAEELKAAADRGEPDDGSHYYEHWLSALERLVTSKRLADSDELVARKEEWADAYRHTPHGKPVELRKSHDHP